MAQSLVVFEDGRRRRGDLEFDASFFFFSSSCSGGNSSRRLLSCVQVKKALAAGGSVAHKGTNLANKGGGCAAMA